MTRRRRTSVPRTAMGAVCLLLVCGLTACGGSADQDTGSGAGAEASPGATPASPTVGDALAAALQDPGDDLLRTEPSSAVLEGTDAELTWRFPETYEDLDPQTASTEVDGEAWDLQVGARPGVDREAEAARQVEEAPDDTEAAASEVGVRGETLSLVTYESEFTAARSLLWSPDGTDVTYVVVQYGPPPLAGPDPERLEELAQLVGSLTYDGQAL